MIVSFQRDVNSFKELKGIVKDLIVGTFEILSADMKNKIDKFSKVQLRT